MKTITIGSDFSGVGAFDYAMNRVAEKKGFQVENIFACDIDKYARQTYAHNHGTPPYFPADVYERKIPAESLDIYLSSPPCQSFSIAGNRKGKDDKRGILFFNSLEFIKINNPRIFIFENVKGLLSDDEGRTFSEWVNLLGGKSVNGNPVLFPYEGSVGYHLYWKVLNAKNYGVPQNRERVFLIGIRDDEDNQFHFPREEPLIKRLKDVLEKDVDEVHYLSDKMLDKITIEAKENGEVANLNKGGERGAVYSEESRTMTSLSATDYKQPKQILSSCYEKENGTDLILLGMLPNETYNDFSRRVYSSETIGRAIMGSGGGCNDKAGLYFIGDVKSCALRSREKEDGNRKRLEFRKDDLSNSLTSQNIDSLINSGDLTGKIRRLTPRECFRLMDFPDTFDFSVVSNTQAYKQAGNSIVIRCLELIILNLNKL